MKFWNPGHKVREGCMAKRNPAAGKKLLKSLCYLLICETRWQKDRRPNCISEAAAFSSNFHIYPGAISIQWVGLVPALVQDIAKLPGTDKAVGKKQNKSLAKKPTQHNKSSTTNYVGATDGAVCHVFMKSLYHFNSAYLMFSQIAPSQSYLLV